MRSLAWAMMLVVALGGAGLLLPVLALGGAVATAGAIAFFTCLAGVILLSPIASLRLERPVVLRESPEGPEVLRILGRTRVGLDRIAYRVETPEGSELGQLYKLNRLRPGPRWRVVVAGGESFDIAAPLRSAVRNTFAELSPIAWAARRLRASVRLFRGREPWTGPALLGLTPDGHIVLRCLHDAGSDWTWVVMDEAPVEARPLLLAACVLALAGRP